MMNGQDMFLIISCVFLVLIPVNAQSSMDMDLPPDDAVSSFHGSLSIVVGVMSVLLVLAFCVLLYAKLCRNVANPQNHHGIATRSESRLSGIDRTVIESLPFFRFLSLKGSREGLECAVCLSRFEEPDILRLLPKCKHAFHRDCIDQWLEKHSSCPLCRNKVNAEDISVFSYSSSMHEDPNLELFVQRDQDFNGSSSRFSLGGSFRRIKAIDEDDEEALLHKSNHKIIVSDVVFKHRWSNVSSSDLVFLNSENIVSDVHPETSSDHPKAKRSMSDITALSRSRDVRAESMIGESSLLHNNLKEAKMRNLWLPIAKNTVQWFAKREEKLPTQELNTIVTV